MDYDLIIIGSGPAGYVAALRAGQVGLHTLLIEKEQIGGMCLNWGCIPARALLESAKKLEAVKKAADFGIDGIDPEKLSFNWSKAVNRSDRIVARLGRGIDYLLKKNQVEVVKGQAAIDADRSLSVENRRVKAAHIIIATGSRPAPLGLSLPAERVIEIERLFKLPVLPRQPLIVGQGVHAFELAQFFRLAGGEVSLVSLDERLLPGLDPHLEAYLKTLFKKSGISIFTQSQVKGFAKGRVQLDGQSLPCDAIINASTRKGVFPQSELDLAQENGFLKVDNNLETNIPGIYAVGDVNGLSPFAQAASAQGLAVVNAIKGIKREIDLSRIPINIYTYPEIAQIGLTEPQARDQGIDLQIGEFPLVANGKAMIEGQTEGFIRILSEKKYGQVIGVQIVAEHATDLIGEAAVLMQVESTVYDIASAIHAHPTVSEVFMEAAYDAFGQPLHR